METALWLRLGAVGLEGEVLDGSGPSGMAVNVRSDATWVGTKSARTGDMIATEGEITRLRLIVEGERAIEVGAGSRLTPRAEVGLRHDGGDAETGAGLELGGGLRYSAGPLTVEASARMLVAHEASGYEEWGASVAVRVEPGASGSGLSLELAPEWGRTGSASQQLWSARDAGELGQGGAFEAERRLTAQLGYGCRAHRRPGHAHALHRAQRGGERLAHGAGGRAVDARERRGNEPRRRTQRRRGRRGRGAPRAPAGRGAVLRRHGSGRASSPTNAEARTGDA